MKNLLNYNLIDLRAILLNSNVPNLIAKIKQRIVFYILISLLSLAMLIGFALLATIGIKVALLGLFSSLMPLILCLYELALYVRILFNIKASLNFN